MAVKNILLFQLIVKDFKKANMMGKKSMYIFSSFIKTKLSFIETVESAKPPDQYKLPDSTDSMKLVFFSSLIFCLVFLRF